MEISVSHPERRFVFFSLAGWKHSPTCSSKSAVKLPTSLAAAGRRLKDCLSLTDERLHIFSSSLFFFFFLSRSALFPLFLRLLLRQTRRDEPGALCSRLLWPLRPLITPLRLFLSPSWSNFSNLFDSSDTVAVTRLCLYQFSISLFVIPPRLLLIISSSSSSSCSTAFFSCLRLSSHIILIFFSADYNSCLDKLPL